MAVDRSYEDADGPGEAKPELHIYRGREAHATEAAPAETRSRAEYYEALRAADGRSDQGDDKHGGWDTVDAENRPDLEATRVTPERRTHILDGDSHGGGHRHGTGKPRKTEFPASWSDNKIIDTAVDVARHPDKPPTRQDWNDTWLCAGTRDRVEVSVVIMRSGEILTSWPEEGGPGVVRNPRKDAS